MSDQTQFLSLWPTAIMRDHLPSDEAINQALTDEIMRLDNERADFTTDYLEDNLLTSAHPALVWLRECINHAVIRYIQHSAIDYAVDWHLQGWANVNRFGDYHNLHNHPHAWLSGTYYVSVPDMPVDLPGRADRTPGAISFFDPRPQANMAAIKADGQVDPEYRIQPQVGEILVWPAFLHHLVHPNLSQDNRISVSFNVVLRWSDNYLPEH
ncbi:MAG: hypothetical protein CL395_09195 [Acidiferrobacteraceae bacterium]|jgi:uncharacterized protein (TIGR02466 family)|nr:hypothetical protein [Acidiferrobacteraceae bacterium]MCP4830383.1 hypothetical protein [Pseudomonadota bacterium]HJP06097.1 TIGR02466 family protein [Arenicellales bacterium]|tara:strand:- start:7702 stop:8334 length:633 start_codon:yes stop_codon:yes gene_type:complete